VQHGQSQRSHSPPDGPLAGRDRCGARRPQLRPANLGELTDALATTLRAHLDHEEGEGLAVIDATITGEQFQAFGAEHGNRIAGDVQRYLPWTLEGATPEVTATVLGQLPPPVRQAYRDEWQPAYAKLALWP